jgi:hypothetical protein
VCDEQRGAAFDQCPQRAHQAVHRLVVQRGRRFVQDEDAGVSQQCSCDAQALTLAARQIESTVGQHGVVAAGQGTNEVVGVDHSVPRRTRSPVGDVVGDGAGFDQRDLRQHSDVIADGCRSRRSDVDAVDVH